VTLQNLVDESLPNRASLTFTCLISVSRRWQIAVEQPIDTITLVDGDVEVCWVVWALPSVSACYHGGYDSDCDYDHGFQESYSARWKRMVEPLF